jgi:NADPH-dependent 2,4-dienoyl-CoA reductase/sulfur reductase-like enzyme
MNLLKVIFRHSSQKAALLLTLKNLNTLVIRKINQTRATLHSKIKTIFDSMHIVILGNGISGVTCARHLRKRSDCDITLVSDESDEFFSRTALMYIYMGHMRERDTRPYEPWFWETNRIQRVRARIQRIDFQGKKLFSTNGRTLHYDKLVLALGSKSNKFGWPGQDLDGVHGLYHLQDLAAMERHSAGLRRAVIVGGGLIGVEMAEMFHSRHIPVTFLVREPDFWNVVLPAEESKMISRHLREHHIDLRLGEELGEIRPANPTPDPSPDGRGDKSYTATSERAASSPEGSGVGSKVGSVVTKSGDTIPCGFVGLTVGVSPNIDFLKGSELETNRGILVDDFLQTNLPDVYAVGDCVELRQPLPGRRAIEAVWYTGRMMGETVAHNIATQLQTSSSKLSTPYRPGIWFNSAKFFDIEYQVYGDIRTQLPDNQATLYWEHPIGKKSIRINYERETGAVLGFNLMGVRYRHEVCERWLRDGAHIEAVLQRLGLANFDPEFFPQHEHELVALYNRQTGRNLTLKQKRGLPAVLRFLKGGVLERG